MSLEDSNSTVYLRLTPLAEVLLERLLCGSSVAVDSSSVCAQVHYPPYLFEAFLLEPIDDTRSVAKVGNGVVVVTMTKKCNRMWKDLVIPARETRLLN